MANPKVHIADIGEYSFFKTTFGPDNEAAYCFMIDGEEDWTVYLSLDHCIVSAVGQKWTGPRGAGGQAVDTAAGWFMRMIGAAEKEG